MSDDVPAGWYPDPWAGPGISILRYWDGLQWTHHVHQPAGSAVVPTTPDGQPLAGWWHRAGAATLDSIFGAMASIVVTLPWQVSLQHAQHRLSDELQRRLDASDPHAWSWFLHQLLLQYRHQAWASLIAALVVVAGTTAFLSVRGGSPGQLITGLRTRRRDVPGTLSWGRAAARTMIYSGVVTIVQVLALLSGSWLTVLLAGLVVTTWSVINPLWAAWDGKRQALHDKIVGTNVVRVRR